MGKGVTHPALLFLVKKTLSGWGIPSGCWVVPAWEVGKRKLLISLLVQSFSAFFLHCIPEAYMDSRAFALMSSFVDSCLIAITGGWRLVSLTLHFDHVKNLRLLSKITSSGAWLA